MKNERGFITVSNQLLSELNDRFSFITDANHADFEPVYAVATALDPRFRLALTDDQMAAARSEILRMVSDESGWFFSACCLHNCYFFSLELLALMCQHRTT